MKYLKEYREDMRLTQSQMSLLLGIPLRTYQAYEGGQREPSEWVEKLIYEKLNRYIEEAKSLPLTITDDAIDIFNELQEDLDTGELQGTDIIQAVIVDDELIDWYYNESETLEYMGEASREEVVQYDNDRANIIAMPVRELMFYIEQAHHEKYEK